jgi:hypothetical protein
MRPDPAAMRVRPFRKNRARNLGDEVETIVRRASMKRARIARAQRNERRGSSVLRGNGLCMPRGLGAAATILKLKKSFAAFLVETRFCVTIQPVAEVWW